MRGTMDKHTALKMAMEVAAAGEEPHVTVERARVFSDFLNPPPVTISIRSPSPSEKSEAPASSRDPEVHAEAQGS